MSTEENKAIVSRWVEEFWNQKNPALIDEILSPNYILHNSDGPIQGREAFRQFAAMFQTAIPDLHVTVETILAEGDKVVWRYLLRGTHRGDFLSIPATGKPVALTGIIISRFAGGMWEEDWQDNNLLGLLQQIGAIPAPERA